MKKLSLLAALGLLGQLTVSASPFAIIDITRVPGHFAGNGGEFTVIPGDAFGQSLLGNGYTSGPNGTLVTVNGMTGWQSFCMEIHEDLNGGPYTGTLNNRAINGGVGPVGDPLSVGTAWLYQQFATGVLAGYNYTPGAGRNASANDLQKAIWTLENEIVPQLADPFVVAAIAKFGSLAAAEADNSGVYPVDVINVLGPRGIRQQDQLVLTGDGVPDGGASLMLLGLGLTGIAVFSRRNHKG